jgi:hypothetical protein
VDVAKIFLPVSMALPALTRKLCDSLSEVEF